MPEGIAGKISLALGGTKFPVWICFGHAGRST
jgi:hypothetical protein